MSAGLDLIKMQLISLHHTFKEGKISPEESRKNLREIEGEISKLGLANSDRIARAVSRLEGRINQKFEEVQRRLSPEDELGEKMEILSFLDREQQTRALSQMVDNKSAYPNHWRFRTNRNDQFTNLCGFYAICNALQKDFDQRNFKELYRGWVKQETDSEFDLDGKEYDTDPGYIMQLLSQFGYPCHASSVEQIDKGDTGKAAAVEKHLGNAEFFLLYNASPTSFSLPPYRGRLHKVYTGHIVAVRKYMNTWWVMDSSASQLYPLRSLAFLRNNLTIIAPK